MSRQSLLKILLIFLLSVLISFSLQRYFHFGLKDVQDFVVSAGIWAPLAYTWILFLGLAVPFNPISDTITVTIAALVFPSWLAVLTTFVAQSFALSVNYWLSREYGVKILSKVLSKEEAKKIEDLKTKLHPGWIFGFRFLLPLNAVGFDFISYAAGIARMDFRKFYLASIVPWTLLSLTFFFSAGFLRNFNPGLIFIPLVILITVPALIIALGRKSESRNAVYRFFDKLKTS